MDGLPPEFCLIPGVFPEATLLPRLLAEVPWTDHAFRIFGRTVRMPRRIAWMGPVAYAYSGIVHPAAPMTPTVAEIHAAVEAQLGERYTAVLLNLYRDGQDSMGWHHDADYPHGGQGAIASVSLGANRRFAIRARQGATRVVMELPHGSLLRMAPEAQERWLHALPKTRAEVGPRVNLTFRHVADR